MIGESDGAPFSFGRTINVTFSLDWVCVDRVERSRNVRGVRVAKRAHAYADRRHQADSRASADSASDK